MTGASQCTPYGAITAPTVLCSPDGGCGLRSTFMSARTLRHTPAMWLLGRRTYSPEARIWDRPGYIITRSP
eukprot:535247-Pyramimonas_sp.AAC.1